MPAPQLETGPDNYRVYVPWVKANTTSINRNLTCQNSSNLRGLGLCSGVGVLLGHADDKLKAGAKEGLVWKRERRKRTLE